VLLDESSYRALEIVFVEAIPVPCFNAFDLNAARM